MKFDAVSVIRQSHQQRAKRARTASAASMSRTLSALGRLLTNGVRVQEAVALATGPRAQREIARQMQAALSQGEPLSTAFRNCGLGAEELALVRMGEETGALGERITDAAALMSRKLTQRQKLLQQLFYPFLLLFLLLGLSFFLLIVVLPIFAGLYASMGVTVPSSAQAAFHLADHIQQTPWKAGVILLMGVIVLAALFLWLFGHPKTPWGRHRFQAAVCRRMGLMLQAGISLNTILVLLTDSLIHPMEKRAILSIRKALESGSGIAEALGKTPLFSANTQAMIAAGEHSGTLSETLLQVATEEEQAYQLLTESALRLLEPATLIAVGAVVGWAMLTLMVPLFDLNTLF